MKKLLFAGVTLLALCGQGHAFTNEYGVPVGSQGPSFNCRYAREADEVAICQSADLSAQDRQLAASYDYIMNHYPRTDLDRIWVQRTQVIWRKYRHICGGDPQCIEHAYTDRINVLATVGEELVPDDCVQDTKDAIREYLKHHSRKHLRICE
jgi:uncharacterized protein